MASMAPPHHMKMYSPNDEEKQLYNQVYYGRYKTINIPETLTGFYTDSWGGPRSISHTRKRTTIWCELCSMQCFMTYVTSNTWARTWTLKVQRWPTVFAGSYPANTFWHGELFLITNSGDVDYEGRNSIHIAAMENPDFFNEGGGSPTKRCYVRSITAGILHYTTSQLQAKWKPRYGSSSPSCPITWMAKRLSPSLTDYR